MKDGSDGTKKIDPSLYKTKKRVWDPGEGKYEYVGVMRKRVAWRLEPYDLDTYGWMIDSLRAQNLWLRWLVGAQREGLIGERNLEGKQWEAWLNHEVTKLRKAGGIREYVRAGRWGPEGVRKVSQFEDGKFKRDYAIFETQIGAQDGDVMVNVPSVALRMVNRVFARGIYVESGADRQFEVTSSDYWQWLLKPKGGVSKIWKQEVPLGDPKWNQGWIDGAKIKLPMCGNEGFFLHSLNGRALEYSSDLERKGWHKISGNSSVNIELRGKQKQRRKQERISVDGGDNKDTWPDAKVNWSDANNRRDKMTWFNRGLSYDGKSEEWGVDPDRTSTWNEYIEGLGVVDPEAPESEVIEELEVEHGETVQRDSGLGLVGDKVAKAGPSPRSQEVSSRDSHPQDLDLLYQDYETIYKATRIIFRYYIDTVIEE